MIELNGFSKRLNRKHSKVIWGSVVWRGGAAHIEPTYHGLRPAPSNTKRMSRVTARVIKGSEYWPRPNPSSHTFKLSRPGPVRLGPLVFKSPRPARPAPPRPGSSPLSVRPGLARPGPARANGPWPALGDSCRTSLCIRVSSSHKTVL